MTETRPAEVPVVLLGFGGVGQCLARLLRDNDGYRREGVAVKLHAVFDRGGGVLVPPSELDALLDAKRRAKTVTELESGRPVELDEALEGAAGGVLVDTSITDARTGEPGLEPARRALGRGISVVFASKGPLVAAYGELAELARQSSARIGIGAAVGIPLPSPEVGVLGVRGAGMKRFRGALNDSANQILRDLESGISLDEAVERARLEGTIEEDPSLDLDGWDAAYKLLILARAIWDPALALGDVATSGVTGIEKRELDAARSRRQRIRLIATGERDASGDVRLRCEPETLTEKDPLFHLAPGEKGLVFETEAMGTITLKTSKGGPLATAATVAKDLLNIAAPPSPLY